MVNSNQQRQQQNCSINQHRQCFWEQGIPKKLKNQRNVTTLSVCFHLFQRCFIGRPNRRRRLGDANRPQRAWDGVRCQPLLQSTAAFSTSQFIHSKLKNRLPFFIDWFVIKLGNVSNSGAFFIHSGFQVPAIFLLQIFSSLWNRFTMLDSMSRPAKVNHRCVIVTHVWRQI